MRRMSFEAKVGLALIGMLCLAVIWLTTGHRASAPHPSSPATASRAERLKQKLARLRASENFINRRRALAEKLRDLPTPAVAGQQQIAGAGIGRIDNPTDLSADADLDFDTLKKMALADSDTDNRIVAVWLLGSMDDKPVMPVLMQALSDADPDVRMAALESISDFDNPPIAALSKALDDSDPEIRFEALSVAAEIDDKSVQPLLAKALDDPDEDVRSLAEGLADFEAPYHNPPPQGAKSRQ